jgi:transcriptional regulator with GAF, ATPase, and Fis domain
MGTHEANGLKSVFSNDVRELREVVERAVILAHGGALEFDLPTTGKTASAARPAHQTDSLATKTAQQNFLTKPELQRIERDNLLLALEAADWKTKVLMAPRNFLESSQPICFPK